VLSVDNPRIGRIYRFDVSLMERLSDSEFPMSQLNVQRRMRPAISSLIRFVLRFVYTTSPMLIRVPRNTVYEQLLDHDKVLEYPAVRGMAKNVYFLSHQNADQGGSDDTISMSNIYEVNLRDQLNL
jgi:hypothetical protein